MNEPHIHLLKEKDFCVRILEARQPDIVRFQVCATHRVLLPDSNMGFANIVVAKWFHCVLNEIPKSMPMTMDVYLLHEYIGTMNFSPHGEDNKPNT